MIVSKWYYLPYTDVLTTKCHYHLQSVCQFTLTFFSHSLSSQKGVMTKHCFSRAGTKSFHSITVTIFSSRPRRAAASMLSWIMSNNLGISSPTSAKAMSSFSALSRRTRRHCFEAKSRGPTSIRTGTPFCSQWLNFHPGV